MIMRFWGPSFQHRPHYSWVSRSYLKDSEKGLGKCVKGTSLGVGLVKVEFASKQLHAQQGEDNNKEEEE